MYQALYRKYRPSTFDDVVGQNVVITTIKNALKNDKISHAYIFSGPRGTGKTSIAKLLAKAVNCTTDNSLICDKCVSCTQINNKQTSDVIEIDAASNNGVDEIREIRNKVNLVPTTGKYKIYIIDEVHMLTTGAFNALLKTLEEPPAHALFILATTEAHKIPSTISSRCQKFEFKKISNYDMELRLKEICKLENINYEYEAIKEIAKMSDGGLRDAISMLDQVYSYSNDILKLVDVHEVNGTLSSEDITNFINCILNKNIKDVFKYIDIFYQSGKNIIRLCEEILTNLRNIIIYKISDELIDKKIDYSNYNNVDNQDLINLTTLLNNDINNLKLSNDPKLSLEITLLQFINNLNNEYELNCNKTNNIIEKKENIIEENSSNIVMENKEKITIKDDKININQSIIIKNDENSIENIEGNLEINNDGKPEKSNDLSLENIKELRINNTLSKFNKQYFLNVKSNISLFENYRENKEYSYLVDMIMDSELKAASDEYLIFVCETELHSEVFNKNILKIEELILKSLGKNFKAISTNKDSWNIIKVEFNGKKKEYKYIEESNNILECITKENDNEKNELDEIYGSLVQYEEEK